MFLDFEQWSALHVSAMQGNLDVVQHLVEVGADIEAISGAQSLHQ